ncbi:unnamed protein product [Nippostrongylus brasiliensis]|uniref:Uncharacterized protein n=1 Tax=Nippostrongylus brasiliensis TaxID=27835 RepID=A0A0N4YUW5_NIPBR|nr:unnamed protein product [Nippostrongylus brasiliensis]
MRTFACLLIALLCALLVSAQMEKRASMGGAAFGAMDRLPLDLIQKFYRIGQKRTQSESLAAFGAMDRLPLDLIQKFYRIGQKRTQSESLYRPFPGSYYSIF